ncbi:glycosyl hydrolase 2 galactose-binding domain-containing protein [Ochrobactrum teleogrylli]|uniref:glycosyl hydrolase 2 galactose-binding domain-containing protein n=1 Tax=Ochrobactrum teleogrylli TaxID=2479765 RepID=UPI00384EC66E
MARVGYFLVAVAILASSLTFEARAEATSGKIELQHGWRLIRDDDAKAAQIDVPNAALGDSGYAIQTMPSTVLNTLSKAGVYKDIYYGDNLTKVDNTLWKHQWWYQTKLDVPEGHDRYTLIFNGLNYRGEIWLNGQNIAGPDTVVGMSRKYEFDVTKLVHPGANNLLAVKITPEQRTPSLTLGDRLNPGKGEGVDLTDTWMDWINLKYLGDYATKTSFIPDKGAGIWRKVYLTYGGDVALRNPYVKADLSVPDLKTAKLDVYANLINRSSEPVTGVLRGEISREGKPSIHLEKTVTLKANETREESFTPEQVKTLKVNKPDVWWPYIWGKPNLYNLKLTFSIGDKVSDTATTDFGIRKITQHIDNSKLFPKFKNPGSFYIKVNGRDYLIRGAAYTPDLLFDNNPQRDRDIIRYAKDLGVNMLRWEGKFADDDMLELADKEGIPVMRGLMCCGSWELWSHWDKEDYAVAYATVQDMIADFRSHASAFIWANGSDGLPPAPVLQEYHAILKKMHWQNAVVDTVSARNSDWSGIHMAAPYSWRAPAFWFKGDIIGAMGSIAESGNDETILPLDSLKKFLPADKLWPINDFWYMRAGSAPGNSTLESAKAAIANRYGPADSVEDLARKAQLTTYENVRAQNEAYGALGGDAHKMTIFWMLNSHWPSFFGHLFDYYMKQGGGYFGAKKALQPLSVVFDGYATGNHSKAKIYLVNQTLGGLKNLTVNARLYDINGKLKHEKNVTVKTTGPTTSTVAMTLPRYDDMGKVYFVRLQLRDAKNEVLAENTYWQSAKDDIPENMSPDSMMDAMILKQKQWADFTPLNTMPKVELKTTLEEIASKDDFRRFKISLNNPTDHIAFFVRAELRQDNTAGEILPITYDDNYVTVYPGETREITAEVSETQLKEQKPIVAIEGYNTH